MKFKKISHSLIILIFLTGFATNISAQVKKSEHFYIMHVSSEMFIHPYRGSIGQGIDLVLYPGCHKDASFYIEYADDGKWGYLVSTQYPHLVVHPNGSSPSAGNDAELSYWPEKILGSQFRIDQHNNTIQHRSGRYWHPRGGSAMPGNDTGIVLYDGHNLNTMFKAVDSNKKTIKIELPVTTTTRWNLIYQDMNSTTSKTTGSYTVTMGQMESNSSTHEKETTAAASMESSMFGVGASVSVEMRSLYSKTKSQEKSRQNQGAINYELPAGQAIYIWQKELVASWSDGSIYSMGTYITQSTSKNVTPVN